MISRVLVEIPTPSGDALGGRSDRPTHSGDSNGARADLPTPPADANGVRADLPTESATARGSRSTCPTPPADVEGVEMTIDESGAIHLAWDPVTTDREGRPEYVSRYHVYRYYNRSFFFVIRPFEIGVTERTEFVDASDRALNTPLVFYKITAEDEAGNEPDRRY